MAKEKHKAAEEIYRKKIESEFFVNMSEIKSTFKGSSLLQNKQSYQNLCALKEISEVCESLIPKDEAQYDKYEEDFVRLFRLLSRNRSGERMLTSRDEVIYISESSLKDFWGRHCVLLRGAFVGNQALVQNLLPKDSGFGRIDSALVTCAVISGNVSLVKWLVDFERGDKQSTLTDIDLGVARMIGNKGMVEFVKTHVTEVLDQKESKSDWRPDLSRQNPSPPTKSKKQRSQGANDEGPQHKRLKTTDAATVSAFFHHSTSTRKMVPPSNMSLQALKRLDSGCLDEWWFQDIDKGPCL